MTLHKKTALCRAVFKNFSYRVVVPVVVAGAPVIVVVELTVVLLTVGNVSESSPPLVAGTFALLTPAGFTSSMSLFRPPITNKRMITSATTMIPIISPELNPSPLSPDGLFTIVDINLF